MSGGGNSGDTVDKKYNARMATIAEQQNDWAGEYMNFYKYGVTYDPTEEVQGYYDKQGKFQEIDPNTWKSSSGSGNMTMKDAIKMQSGEYDKNYDPNVDIVTKTRGDIQGYDQSTPSYMNMESQQIASNMEVMPYQTQQAISESQFAQNKADTESRLLNPYESATSAAYGLAEKQALADTSLVPQQTQLRSALNTESLKNIALRSPVTEKYYNETLKGVDVGKRMNQASADVAHSFKDATQTTMRNASRYGIDPNSGRGMSALSGNSLAAARTEVGARGTARDTAEAENYNRLANATALQPAQQPVY